MYTIPHDKALHFIAGVLLFMVGNFISPMVGLGLSFTYGVGKEVYDSFGYGHVELKDALFTFAGGIVGFICSLEYALL